MELFATDLYITCFGVKMGNVFSCVTLVILDEEVGSVD
jgi:hypothetical protein